LINKARILHIDGLRGVAIGLVVAYHLFPNVLRGGFAGVDVFFVISGFVIHRQLMTLDRFSFREFYTRRAIRIFPSLIFVTLSVTLLGRYFFLDYPYRLLLNSVTASSVFFANHYFIGSSNYFDLESASKPLLPLWSLAVEEQFYLLWPLMFWVLFKSYKKFLPALILISFTSTLYFGLHYSNYNFYSLQTRFWEIAVGITLSSLKYDTGSRLIRVARIVLTGLVIPILILGLGEERWPNFYTLVVVLATAVLILAPGQTSTRFLTTPILVFLGRISFPLYLIHWPLISFYSNMKPAYIPLFDKILLLTLAIFSAYLLFKFLEIPIQKLKGSSRTITALFSSFLLLFTGILALSFKSNLPDSSQTIRQSISSSSSIAARNSWYFSGRSNLPEPEIDYSCGEDVLKELVFACEKGKSWSQVDAVVVGDSKAEIVFRALLRNDGGYRWGFIGGGLNPVIPLTGNLVSGTVERPQSSDVSDWISKQDRLKTVVVVSATRNLFSLANDYSLAEIEQVENLEQIKQQFTSWLKPLDTAEKSVYIIRDNPTMRDPTYCHGIYSAFRALDKLVQVSEKTEDCFYALDQFLKDSSKYIDLIEFSEDDLTSIKIVDSTDYFCDSTINTCNQFKNNRLLYSYSDHISDYAADYVVNKLLLIDNPSIL